MNFYIQAIKLWFRANVPAKVYEFKPDKVNVITGDSSTGKSSLLSVIDYCLLSGESNIVEEVININVEWYGMVFHLDGVSYVVIRKNPKLELADQQIFFEEAEDFPESDLFVPNTTRGELLLRFNELFHTPKRKFSASKKEIVSVDFRSFLPMNYLTEDVIATQNTYFDTKFFKDPKLDAIIKEVLKLAIGIDDGKKEDLEFDLKNSQVALEKEIKRRKRYANEKNKYISSLNELMKEMTAIGLIEGPLEISDSLREKLETILKGYIDILKKCEPDKELEALQEKLRKVKVGLQKANRLKKSIESYNQSLDRISDSLKPIDYLARHSENVMYTDDTRLLLENLITTFRMVKVKAGEKRAMPTDLLEHIERLELEEKALKEQIERKNHIRLRAADTSWVCRLMELQHELYNLNIKTRIMSEGEFLDLTQRCETLKHKLDKMVTNYGQMMSMWNERIGFYLSGAKGLSDAYSSCKPDFNIERLSLELQREDEVFKITNVGSKCNFMFMHLCVFLGLHEHAINKGIDCLPNFLFIDQPSIPFYADKTVDDGLRNDDKMRLSYAFNLLEIFMSRVVKFQYKHPFQVIMVEHADPSYWEGKFEHFETRYEFVKGKDSGLIPNEVYRRL